MSKASFDLPPETIIAPKFSTQITSLSPRQQDRLEAQGKFPKSIKLGSGRNGRKGRVLAEILEWNRARIAERNGGVG
jgi:predicted DNA-binding transcriptional regulator AlpA